MKIYRIILVVLLVAVIGGGAWYCFYMNRQSAEPADGTLVEKCVKECGDRWT